MEGETKKKAKVTEEGEPCRHCGTPVKKYKTKEKPRGRRAYYYEYYLRCPKFECRTFYIHPESKRFWSENS